MTDQLLPQSRRSILAAALGGLGAAAVAALARPLPVKALATPMLTETSNTATAPTGLTNTTADQNVLNAVATGGGTAIQAQTTSGTGLLAEGGTGIGVLGRVTSTDKAGVVGTAGDTADSTLAADLDLDSGVYGYADQTFISSGVWGESTDGVGVAATGALGLIAQGFDGTYTEALGGTALHAHTGGGVVPTPPTNAALFASVGSASQIGLEARGRIRFPHRSGRATIAKGKSSVTVTVTGVTSSNIVIAVLNSSGGGRYVRTAIPYTGKIVIYLNAAATGTTSVGWLVLG